MIRSLFLAFFVGISPSSTSLLICNRSPSAELRPLRDTASLFSFSAAFLSLFFPSMPVFNSASLELTLDNLLLGLWSVSPSGRGIASRLFSTGLKASFANLSSSNSESEISSIPEACGGVLSEGLLDEGKGMPLKAEVAACIPEADTPGTKELIS